MTDVDAISLSAVLADLTGSPKPPIALLKGYGLQEGLDAVTLW